MAKRPDLIPAPLQCTLCLKNYTNLPRHLARTHNMTVAAYQKGASALFAGQAVPVIELTNAFEVTASGHVRLMPGAKRADGRDADKAREYQRRYRAGLAGPRAPPPPPPTPRPRWNRVSSATLLSLIENYYTRTRS